MKRESPNLFERYPSLSRGINWLSLGDYPTPVQRMERLGQKLGLKNIWVKRDDLSNKDYGGNKVRKLEFLLADAKAKGRDSVLTLGAAGSNHVLATTVHAKSQGLKSLAVMVPQPVHEYARTNLLANFNLGCEIHYVTGNAAVPLEIARVYLSHWDGKTGSRPYFIWAGGTTPLGVLGYVDCGLEIAGQVKRGEIPAPDYVFCAVGSAGTFAGLWLGLKLAGLKTEVIGVRVYDYIGASEYMVAYHTRRALSLLRRFDPGVPMLKINGQVFHMIHDCFGGGYAHFTRRGMEAIELAKELEGVKLEGTYTGKTLAGLMGFAAQRGLKEETLLFINSYNSFDLARYVDINTDYTRLPVGLHRYFLEPDAGVED